MKRTKTVGSIIAITAIISVMGIGSIINEHLQYGYLKDKSISIENWAYCNKGQKVNGKKGVKGIDVNIIPIWKRRHEVKSVIVALVDTGVYTNGKYLKDHLWTNKDELEDRIDNDGNGLVDDLLGWDFRHNDNSIYDNYAYDYHGTYLANEIVRINPSVKIMPCKFMDGVRGTTLDASKSIEYAINKGAKVINCSWMFYDNATNIETVIKNNPNVLFVCSAGNSNLNLDDTPAYPACYNESNVISVGAIDNQGVLYEYGGYGRSNTDIMAPGESIKVILPEDDEDSINGTSVATSYVTACASILWGLDEDLSAEEIKNIIIEGAHERGDLSAVCSSGGILDVYGAYLQMEKRE